MRGLGNDVVLFAAWAIKGSAWLAVSSFMRGMIAAHSFKAILLIVLYCHSKILIQRDGSGNTSIETIARASFGVICFA